MCSTRCSSTSDSTSRSTSAVGTPPFAEYRSCTVVDVRIDAAAERSDRLAEHRGVPRFGRAVLRDADQQLGVGERPREPAHEQRAVQLAVPVEIQNPEFALSSVHAPSLSRIPRR